MTTRVFKNYTRIIAALFLIIIAGWFTGCDATKHAIIDPLPKVTPELVTEARNALLANESKIRTIKARVVIKVRNPAFRTSTKLNSILRFKRPDVMRMIVSKLTFTIFDMTHADNQIWLYVPQENRVYAGYFDKTMSVGGMGITFKPYDLVNIFNYNNIFKDKTLYMEQDDDNWVIRIIDTEVEPARHLANLYFDRGYLMLKYELIADTGELGTIFKFSDYQEFADCSFPQTIEIDWPQDKTTFQLDFRELSVNHELPDKIFDFNKPLNSEIIPIGGIY